jgi:hypothetical protein
MPGRIGVRCCGLRRFFAVGGVIVAGLNSAGGWAAPIAAARPAGCVRGVLEGEVQAGAGYVRPVGGGLEVMLEPLASGWRLRVLPVGGRRPAHDYAELATPPYESVSPLLISTDFSFRAQDAVAWNPRHLRFAADGRSFQRMLELYGEYRRTPSPSAAVQEELAKLVSRAPEGTVEILDAHLVPGTADQSKVAALVASHFSTTAHTLEQPADGKSTALGRLTWIRFRISLDLPEGSSAGQGMRLERRPCS